MTSIEFSRIAVRALAAGVIVSGCLAGSLAFGQETPKPVDSDPRQFVVFRLAHADARDVAQVLTGLVKDGKFGVDERTNSLVVSASSDAQEAVKSLIEQLDNQPAQAPAPPRPDQSMKIFSLANARANDLAAVLVSVIKDGRVAVDERTNAIILSGDEESLRIADAMIMRLDAEAATKKDSSEGQPTLPSPVQVRLVWLVSGLEDRRSPPTKDLEPVVAELGKLGIDNLQVVTNAIVNVRGNEFTLLGTPELEAPVRLEVTGILDWNSTDPHPLLNIDLDVRDDHGGRLAAKDANSPPRNLVSLSSTIDAPYGQFVVLGAAPLGKLTSVFVLQVVPK